MANHEIPGISRQNIANDDFWNGNRYDDPLAREPLTIAKMNKVLRAVRRAALNSKVVKLLGSTALR